MNLAPGVKAPGAANRTTETIMPAFRRKKPACTNSDHNVGESPCPDCGCGFTDPCMVVGCPHCDQAASKEARALTRTARALKLAEATMLRQEKRSALVLGKLLKTRAEVVRLRARLARMETPNAEEG